jgi:hypothetical protein
MHELVHEMLALRYRTALGYNDNTPNLNIRKHCNCILAGLITETVPPPQRPRTANPPDTVAEEKSRKAAMKYQ